MVKCGVCSVTVSNKQIKIECRDCGGVFHANCVNLSKSDVEYILEERQIWRCSSCSKSKRASMALETSVDEGKASISDVIIMLNEAKEDRKRLENELGKSLNLCHEKIEENMKVLQSQNMTMEEYFKKIEQLNEENKTLKAKVISLEEKLEDNEQYSRLNCVEIRGVPMEKNENIIETVKKVGMALDMQIKEEMVDACHRLRNKKDGSPPTIIVKFVRRLDKQILLQKRRVKRTLSTAQMGYPTSSPVYINESLTFLRVKIHAAAREIKKEKNYKFLWVRDGKVLLRKEENSPVIVLTKLEDINKL